MKSKPKNTSFDYDKTRACCGSTSPPCGRIPSGLLSYARRPESVRPFPRSPCSYHSPPASGYLAQSMIERMMMIEGVSMLMAMYLSRNVVSS